MNRQALPNAVNLIIEGLQASQAAENEQCLDFYSILGRWTLPRDGGVVSGVFLHVRE